MREIRISTLQWASGSYCALFGAVLLVAPHRLPALPFASLDPAVFWLGLAVLAAGMVLIAAAARVPGRPLTIGAHLLAATVILLVIVRPLLIAQSWLGAIIYGTLGASLILAPFLPTPRTTGRANLAGDLFALTMGLSTTLSGALFLLAPEGFSAALELVQPALPWFGLAFLAAGGALTFVHLASAPRPALVAAHLFAAVTLWAWLVALLLPRPTGWNPHLYYGGFGLALALYPWLAPYVARVDPASLRARLTLTLAALVAIPLTLALAIVADGAERRATAQALTLQQSLAAAVADDVASYIALNRATVVALANQADLLQLPPERQRAQLQALAQAYPDIFALQLSDAAGEGLVRSDELPPPPVRGFPIYEEARRTMQPALDLLISPTRQTPVLGFATPILDAEGRFAGLASGGMELNRLTPLLVRAQADSDAVAFLLDADGRVLAHPDESQIFTSRAAAEPFISLQRAARSSGTLRYSQGRSREWIAGYTEVPTLGWTVVIERPLAEALADIHAQRDRAFATLLLLTGLALACGMLLARLLNRPLGLLAHAADRYASGNSAVPLPASRLSEVAQLSHAFGAMRERLDARSAENLRLLREAEFERSRFAVTLASIGDAVIATDTAGSVTFINPVAANLTGWPAGSALGQPLDAVFRIVNERSRQPVESPVTAVLRSGTIVGLANHTILLARDGREVPIDDSGAPIRDDAGVVQGVVLVFRDTSERRQSELRERLLIDLGSALAATLDQDEALRRIAAMVVPLLADFCRVDRVDEAGAIRLVAHEPGPAEATGQLVAADKAHPVRRVLQGGEPVLERDLDDGLLAALAPGAPWAAVPDGRAPRSLIVVPLRARERTLAALTMVAVGPERRYGQGELLFAQDLAQRAALAIDNARLYSEARQAVRVRDTFLSIAAHELKTPLTSLLGQAQLVQRRLAAASGLGERDRRALATILAQSRRLSQMVDALLDISRLDQGRFSIVRAPVDLCALARRLVEELQPSLELHRVECDAPDEVLLVEGDELRLTQVLQNLIQNAIKYSPEGGPVTVRLQQRGEQVVVQVRDQGIGIPEEALPQLFRPFYRASNAEAQQIVGMGVGLYVVKEVVALHGGTISVESREGAGSSFTIALPLRAPAAPVALGGASA